MKFEYDNGSENRECVAYAHRVEHGSEDTTSIAVKTGQDERGVEQVVTFYYDGQVVKQDCYEASYVGDEGFKKFYPGDKLTITF